MAIFGRVWGYRLLIAFGENDKFSYILKYFKSIWHYKGLKQKKQQILWDMWTPAHN